MPLSNAEVLSRCPLFAELDRDDLEALAAIAHRQHFDKDQMVFLANERPDALRVVISGSVKIFVLSPQSGRELVLTVEHPFNAVAELPSFDEAPYPANAQALEASELLLLEEAAFKRVLRERPEIALHLMRTLGRRLRRLVALIEQLSFQEVVQRLARYLLEHAEDGLPFELETNASIAAQLGTVPELVSRNLSRLHQSGAVGLAGRRVEAVNRPALTTLAEGSGR